MKKRTTIVSVCLIVAILLMLLSFNGTTKVRAQAHDRSAAPSDLVVVDSLGKQIGPFFGSSYVPETVLDFNGLLLRVWVNPQSLTAGPLMFMTPDCSSQPYTQPFPSVFRTTAMGNFVLYYDSGPAQMLNAPQSLLYGDINICEKLQ